MSKSTILKVLLFIVLLFLWSSVLQSTFNLFDEPPLKGMVDTSKDLRFDLSGWFTDEYQIQKELFLKENFGFRNTCIRFNNQLDFYLFNRANAKSVVIGNNNYLYESAYIDNYFGMEYKGDDYFKSMVFKLNLLHDTLMSLDKTLIIAIAPGKGSYFIEHIPDSMINKKSKNNYESFIENSKSYPHLNIINFHDFFMKIKNKTPYELFPKYGIHWSSYGASIANDSIINFIEQKRNIELKKGIIKNYELREAYGVDYDIADGMNLLFRIGSDTIAYPVFEYVEPENYAILNLAAIGDSFFWNIYKWISYSFQKRTFLFYNKATSGEETHNVSMLDTKNIILESEVIMIMVNEAKIQDLGWGFIDNAIEIFGLNTTSSKIGRDKQVLELIEKIKQNPDWFESIKTKAKSRGLSIEQMLYDDANWIIEQDYKPTKSN